MTTSRLRPLAAASGSVGPGSVGCRGVDDVDVIGDGVVDGDELYIVEYWRNEAVPGWCFGDLTGDGYVTEAEDDPIVFANSWCDQSQ